MSARKYCDTYVTRLFEQVISLPIQHCIDPETALLKQILSSVSDPVEEWLSIRFLSGVLTASFH